MDYHYDPILCMNVPDSTSKAKDAKALDDAKADFQKVISLTKQIDDITKRYARKIDANAMFAYTDQIRRKVQYYIDNADRGWYDAAPADVRDAKIVDENYIVSGMKSQLGQMLKRYKDPKNRNQLVSQYIGIVNNHRANGKVTEEEFNEFVKYAKRLVGGSHDSLDRAIRTVDKFTVWESDEYDDIYVSYEGGTYVLYVENRPQADGSQQKMIQLGKQEERMRG